MNKRELYALLDIESPEEFEYFENLADYLECEEELDYTDVAELFNGVNKDVLAQLCDNYFEKYPDSFREARRRSLPYSKTSEGLWWGCAETAVMMRIWKQNSLKSLKDSGAGIPSTARHIARILVRWKKRGCR